MAEVFGILETSLYVSNLDTSHTFFVSLFGFQAITRNEKMSALRVSAGQVLLLFHRGACIYPTSVLGGLIPAHDGDGRTHLAFAVRVDEFPIWQRTLSEMGIVVESKVTWTGGRESLYFRDPDGHLLELASADLWDRCADDKSRKR